MQSEMAAFFVLTDYLLENIELIMKKTIRLTESDLHRVIKESVKRVLRENSDYPPSEFGEVWDGLSKDASVYCTPEEIEMYDKIGNDISDLYDEVTAFYDHAKELRYSNVAKQLEDVINMIKQIFPKISDTWAEFVGTKNAIDQQQERGYLYGKQSADFEEAENGRRAAGY